MATPEHVKKTIQILSKVIKTPKLDEKLLTRPPIKFQRDIFESIIKTTGFMKNLFDKGSVDDAAMKSRDKKRAMFVKVLTLLELVSKKELGIDVDKILAGQESDKTNLMLQIVGRLAAKSDCVANNAKYVKAVNKKISGSSGAENKNSGTEVVKSGKTEKEAVKEEPVKAKEPSKRSRTNKPEAVDMKKSKTRQNSKSPTKTRERSKSPQKAQNQVQNDDTEENKNVEDNDARNPRLKVQRPPSAVASKRRQKQPVEAESDEVEIDEDELEAEIQAHDQRYENKGENEDIDENGRPKTSGGARPVTRSGRHHYDPFLVQRVGIKIRIFLRKFQRFTLFNAFFSL